MQISREVNDSKKGYHQRGVYGFFLEKPNILVREKVNFFLKSFQRSLGRYRSLITKEIYHVTLHQLPFSVSAKYFPKIFEEL